MCNLLLLLLALVALVLSFVWFKWCTELLPTHCYEITHGGICMWPPGWYAAVDEAEALTQFEREECSSMGDVKLWSYSLVVNETSQTIQGYDPRSRTLLATRTCSYIK